MVTKTYVIYHQSCADGFASAYVAWQHFGDKAEYIPAQYGDPLPELDTPLEDALIFMLDISWDRETIVDLEKRARNLLVIDHHKTAEKELEGLDFAIFDMNHSAAVLAWCYFNAPGTDIPMLIKYVEDRDLWKWEMPDSEAINAVVASTPMDFESWAILDSDLAHEPFDIAEAGNKILSYRNKLVAQICSNAYLGYIDITADKSSEVPIVCTPILQSEVCHKLLEDHPDAPYAAAYWESRTHQTWSLRSAGEVDVSEIAKYYGGGGHHSAAGFRVEV